MVIKRNLDDSDAEDFPEVGQEDALPSPQGLEYIGQPGQAEGADGPHELAMHIPSALESEVPVPELEHAQVLEQYIESDQVAAAQTSVNTPKTARSRVAQTAPGALLANPIEGDSTATPASSSVSPTSTALDTTLTPPSVPAQSRRVRLASKTLLTETRRFVRGRSPSRYDDRVRISFFAVRGTDACVPFLVSFAKRNLYRRSEAANRNVCCGLWVAPGGSWGSKHGPRDTQWDPSPARTLSCEPP